MRSGSPRLLAAAILLVSLLAGLAAAQTRPAGPVNLPPLPLDKDELAFLFGQVQINPHRLDRLRINAGGGRIFEATTTIDPALQAYAARKLETALAPYAALAALDPRTGRVQALAWITPSRFKASLATTPAFPAASIFKMVTAAAALEAGGLTPGSKIPFTGRSHSLTEAQIRDGKAGRGQQPTLAEAFAMSINPVFGKLANRPLGPRLMQEFAQRHGFNQAIHFELPTAPSRATIPQDDPFALAAVGSGFNRETTLSPLHGALMAAAVVNQGVMPEPTIFERVDFIRDGRPAQTVYRQQAQAMRRIYGTRTAANMRVLMSATTSRGTSRYAFRQAPRDRVLKHLEVGGKTGSINDPTVSYRVDWFVGYGLDERSGESLAVAVLVAHDLERRGVRSSQLARDIIRFHFDPRREDGASLDSPEPAKKAPKKSKTRSRSSSSPAKSRAKSAYGG